MNGDATNGNGNGNAPVGAGPLAWFTNGVARWLLIVIVGFELAVVAIVFAIVTTIDPVVLFGAVVSFVMLVAGGLLPLMGARQMADAKDKTASPAPPESAPPGPAGT